MVAMPIQPDDVEATCTDCGETKPISEFRTNQNYLRCKPCHHIRVYKWRAEHPKEWKLIQRRGALKKKYGITVEQYEDQYDKQNGLCAICEQPERVRQWLAVDEHPGTGKLRALLCTQCNVGLGNFGDSIEILEAAVEYLRRHNARR